MIGYQKYTSPEKCMWMSIMDLENLQYLIILKLSITLQWNFTVLYLWNFLEMLAPIFLCNFYVG